MDDVIKVRESLEKLGLLIDGATERVKHEKRKKKKKKKQEGGFFWTYDAIYFLASKKRIYMCFSRLF